MVRDRPDLCFWICWNWAVAKRSEYLSLRSSVAGTPDMTMELLTLKMAGTARRCFPLHCTLPWTVIFVVEIQCVVWVLSVAAAGA
jgi:hypothetical protein